MIERLSIPETARRLGVSETQIRRQVKAGQLAAEREVLKSGVVRWWVTLLDAPPPPAPPARRETPVELPVLELLEVLTGQQEEVRRLTELVAEQQDHLRELTTALEAAHAVVRQLAAGGGHPGGAEPPALPKSSATRRWWGRLVGAS